MPGPDAQTRAGHTLLALLAFASHGNTPPAGVFRSHVARLTKFLRSLTGLDQHRSKQIDKLLAKAEKGKVPKGDWLARTQDAAGPWQAIDAL
jgi:hypothetical protein